MKKLVKETLNESQSLPDLRSLIESRFKFYDHLQNFEIDIDEDEDAIIEFTVMHNAGFEDNEGRHPWMEIHFMLDMENKTIHCKGELGSKDGSIEVSLNTQGSFNENNSVKSIATIVEGLYEEMSNHLQFEGEDQLSFSHGDDDDDDEDNYEEINDYALEFISDIEKTGLEVSVEEDDGIVFINVYTSTKEIILEPHDKWYPDGLWKVYNNSTKDKSFEPLSGELYDKNIFNAIVSFLT